MFFKGAKLEMIIQILMFYIFLELCVYNFHVLWSFINRNKELDLKKNGSCSIFYYIFKKCRQH